MYWRDRIGRRVTRGYKGAHGGYNPHTRGYEGLRGAAGRGHARGRTEHDEHRYGVRAPQVLRQRTVGVDPASHRQKVPDDVITTPRGYDDVIARL